MRLASYIVIGIVEVLLVVWFMRDRVPLTVAGYLGFCPQHISACEDKVVEIDTTLRLTYMPGAQYCPPDRPDRAGEERKVRDWLSAHPNMSRRSSTTGIGAALLAIHHCEIRLSRILPVRVEIGANRGAVH